jgi:uncharacterized RDD family membrane protein YckC
MLSVASVAPLRYAGYWLRALAAILDLIFLAIPLSVFVSFLAVAKGTPLAYWKLHADESPSAVRAAFGGPSILLILCFFVLLSWLYFAILESSIWQGTIGKKILGLSVADLQDKRIPFARATVRFAAGRLLLHVPSVGLLYFFVDCICAGLTPRKQAIHDMVAGCLVLRRSAGDNPSSEALE